MMRTMTVASSIIIVQDVVITIPVPHGVGTPNVAECDGDYTMDTRRGALLWQVNIEYAKFYYVIQFSCPTYHFLPAPTD